MHSPLVRRPYPGGLRHQGNGTCRPADTAGEPSPVHDSTRQRSERTDRNRKRPYLELSLRTKVFLDEVAISIHTYARSDRMRLTYRGCHQTRLLNLAVKFSKMSQTMDEKLRN